MALPTPVTELLGRQHGVGARQQLLELDENPDRWRRSGLMQQMYRGVWRAAGSPESPWQLLMAAVLRCGEGACANGKGSCWLLGLEGFSPAVGVVVPTGRQVTGAPFSVKATVLGEQDLMVIDNVPCLTATRAIIDVAPSLTDKSLRVTIDSARRLGLLTIERLEARAAELRGLTGARKVLRVIGSRVLDQESEGERVLAKVFVDFPGLEWGVSDLVPNRRLDCLIRDALLVLEYDGRDHHVLPTDRDADGLRDLEIRSVKVNGIPLEVIRITKGMLAEAPEAVREFVQRRRAERRAEIAARQNSQL